MFKKLLSKFADLLERAAIELRLRDIRVELDIDEPPQAPRVSLLGKEMIWKAPIQIIEKVEEPTPLKGSLRERIKRVNQ